MTQRATIGAEVYEEMQDWLAENRDGTGKLLRHNQINALVSEITRLRDEIRGIYTVAQIEKPKAKKRPVKKTAAKKAAKKVAAKKR